MSTTQESIRQLLDDSKRFLSENGIHIPFETETTFVAVSRRIDAGTYPDHLLFAGQEKGARGIYYLFTLAGNESDLAHINLSHYGFERDTTTLIERNARTAADFLRTRWQELGDNLAIDYGLRVAECSPASKQQLLSLYVTIMMKWIGSIVV